MEKKSRKFLTPKVLWLLLIILAFGFKDKLWAQSETYRSTIFVGIIPATEQLPQDIANIKNPLIEQVRNLKRIFKSLRISKNPKNAKHRIDDLQLLRFYDPDRVVLEAYYSGPSVSPSDNKFQGKCRDCLSKEPKRLAIELLNNLLNKTILHPNKGALPTLKVEGCEVDEDDEKFVEIESTWPKDLVKMEENLVFELGIEPDGKRFRRKKVYFLYDDIKDGSRSEGRITLRLELLRPKTEKSKEFIENCNQMISNKKMSLWMRMDDPREHWNSQEKPPNATDQFTTK